MTPVQLPEVPKASHRFEDPEGDQPDILVYTADQLHAYGQQCARAASCGGGEVVSAYTRMMDDAHAFEDELAKYVKSYEFIGEDEEGRETHYTPNDGERLLIEDAIRSWVPPDTTPPTPSAGVEVTEDMVCKALDGLLRAVNTQAASAICHGMTFYEQKQAARAALTAALEGGK